MDATATFTPAKPLATDTDVRGLKILSAAHIINDANQSVLPAMIPFLIAHHGFSLAAAGSLVLAMNLSSSIVQPLFGHLSDRRAVAWVIPLALVLACCGTAFIGMAPTLPLMFLGALVAGIGVAAFHPESSRFANYFAGSARSTGMSWFTLGGYLGFAIGPLAVTPALHFFGLHGTAVLVLPGVIMAVLLWRDLPRFARARARAHHAHRERVGHDDWRAFSLLTATVSLRSMVFSAAVTFMPVFAIRIAHVDANLGSVILTLLLFAGAAGTLWGGRMGERHDRRRVISLSLLCAGVSAIALAVAGFYVPVYPLLCLLAIVFGVSLGLSAGVIVVVGQEYLPKRIGVASGVTLGLAVTIGGLSAPVFGAIGDHYGLVVVFATVALCALLSLAWSFFLPRIHAITTR